MKKYKPEKIRRISLVLTLVNIAVLLLIVFSFFQAISITNDYPFPETYVSHYREVDNTKSFLKRNLLKIWFALHPLSADTIRQKLAAHTIGIIDVEADTAELRKLDVDLPKSGREYVAVKLKKGDEWKDAEIHYRGDSFYHWGYEKKSYVIRRKDKTKINLINPKSDSFIADKLAADLARDMFSIMTPENKWTGLFINGSFKGIYQEVQDVNDRFAAEHNFSSVLEGETILFKDSGGAELFNDPNKWSIEAGYISKNNIADFLDAFQEGKNSFFSLTDLDYFVNFYTWVSIIHNVHYDKDHNWVIGVKNGKYYPFVNDPWPWFTSYHNGNGVEEINSPISKLLRKNRTFNQLFAQNLWYALEGDKIKHYLNTHSEEEIHRLSAVLEFDRYKGGIINNEAGTRGPTSTKKILKNIEALRTHINKRLSFLKDSLKSATVIYYYDEKNQYLYLKYTGIAGGYLELSDNQVVEYYNAGGFGSHVSSPFLLTSGRTVEQKSFYASVCPTTYRIKIKKFSMPVVTHSLTKEKIKVIKEDMWKMNDCASTTDISEKTLESSPHTSLPRLSLTYKDMGVVDLFQTADKVKENIFAEFRDKSAAGKLKKKRFHDDLVLTLDTPIDKQSEYRLIPDTDESDSFQQAVKAAKENGQAVPLVEKIMLTVNNFEIGTYLLTDYPGKAFFETNNLSFDADIFVKDGLDTLDETNWKQVSESPHSPGKALIRLQSLLKAAKEGKDINKYVSVSSVRDIYNFAKSIGSKTMEYALYFDESEARFRIVPYYYTIQNEEKFSFADPLLSALTKTITDNASDMPLLEESIGDWKILKKGNTITLQANRKYTPNDTLVIAPDTHLIIPQGVTIEMAPGKSIIVFGKITIQGTKADPVIITSSGKKSFGSLAIVGGHASASRISHLIVRNGGDAVVGDYYFSGMTSVYGANNIEISDSTFINSSSDDALHFVHTHFQVRGSLFMNNHADGIDSDYSQGIVTGSYFMDNGNDGIDFSGSNASVNDSVVAKSADKCVSVGEKSQITFDNVFFEGCRIGVESKDSSISEVSHAIFSKNIIAAHTYQKKSFFNDGILTITNSVLIDNNQDLVSAVPENKPRDTVSSKTDPTLTRDTLAAKDWEIKNKNQLAGLSDAGFFHTYAATYK